MTKQERGYIKGLRVDQLFGLYNYAAGSYGTVGPFDPSLIVLYGDNGSGKTTLLQLLYHTLSREQKRGHRSALTRIPVKRFSVRLSDGTEVSIVRRGQQLKGAYTYILIDPAGRQLECNFIIDQKGSANPAPNDEDSWEQIMGALERLGVALYYLSDNRRSEDAVRRPHEIDIDLADYDFVLSQPTLETLRRRREHKSVLDSAVSDLAEVIRHEAISAANIGEANMNSIYADIAKRVVRAKGQQVAASEAQVKDLVNALEQLMQESKPFSALGLMPDLDLRDLVSMTVQAKATTRKTLATVLQPYVESVTARLNALRPIQSLIDTLVGTLNRFYTQKHVRFNLREGLRVLQHNGTAIPPQALSSGEQQLLLLFCNTVRARSQATIFIIDEPELSLNVKWQRRLLNALLDLVTGTEVQFAIATHSVELLATHKNTVIRLAPPSGEVAK